MREVIRHADYQALIADDLFATAMKATQMPMLITDPNQTNHPIVFVNDAFLLLTGYGRDEVLGRNCRFLQGLDTDADAIDRIRNAILQETEIQIDVLNYRKDGSKFWNALYLSPTRGSDGHVKFFFASQIDVTDRIEANRVIAEEKSKVEVEIARHSVALEHLKIAKAIAENAGRQKADFVANMSHELRTPLTGMLGLLDLLEADPTIQAKQRRYLIMAHEAGRSLLAIVNDILDFSKIEAGELTIDRVPFEMLPLMESCEDLAAEAARLKNLVLNLHVPDLSLVLLGDPARLKQILLNLLTNAIKFTNHGQVTVSARFNKDDGLLRCEVSDTGIGIAEDHMVLMFKRFSQADMSITRRFGGTGLGLAICHRLVSLMGGTIGVQSKPGEGSTFWFEVPAQETQRITPAENSKLGVLSPKRILLAEDNFVNQEIIKAMLESRGHVVTIVENGAAAASTVQTDPTFDFILMDLQMPIMDGLSACRIIRAAERSTNRPAIPMIALTANAMVEDVQQCLAAGMDGHVAKPIEWGCLFSTMEKLDARNCSSAVAA